MERLGEREEDMDARASGATQRGGYVAVARAQTLRRPFWPLRGLACCPPKRSLSPYIRARQDGKDLGWASWDQFPGHT